MLTLSLVVSGTLLIALFTGLLLRPIVRKITEKMKNFPTLLFWGMVRVALAVTPYACLWLSFTLLSGIFPSFPEGTDLLILFFTLLFLYRGAMALCRVLLSPDERHFRLLPLEDENANYLFIWAKKIRPLLFLLFHGNKRHPMV